MAKRQRQRHPRFRGYVCIVKDCTRVEYKHELCRNHWQEVPLEQRLRIASDSFMAAYNASRKHDPAIRRWAQQYSAGTAASAASRVRAQSATPSRV